MLIMLSMKSFLKKGLKMFHMKLKIWYQIKSMSLYLLKGKNKNMLSMKLLKKSIIIINKDQMDKSPKLELKSHKYQLVPI